MVGEREQCALLWAGLIIGGVLGGGVRWMLWAWLIEWACSLGAGHGVRLPSLLHLTVPPIPPASLTLTAGEAARYWGWRRSRSTCSCCTEPRGDNPSYSFIPTANGHYNLVTFFFFFLIIGCLTLISRLWAYLAFFPKDALLRSGWIPLLFGAIP